MSSPFETPSGSSPRRLFIAYSSRRRVSRWPSARRIVSTAFCSSSLRPFAKPLHHRVVPLALALVRTRNPGNLGSAARAAKAFGAELLLLDPRCDPADLDARAFASGAEDVLDSALTLSSWEDLVRGADALYALTAMRGRLARGLPPARSWSTLRTAAASRRVVIVVGPERSGLTTDELRSCEARLTIRTRPEFPTLSIAQASAVALALAQPLRATRDEDAAPLATAAALARMLTSLRETLLLSGWAGDGRSKDALGEIESLLLRAQPTAREVTLLLGALAALKRR
jgi:TrmH family RNA methyltransferase